MVKASGILVSAATPVLPAVLLSREQYMSRILMVVGDRSTRSISSMNTV